LRCEKSALQFLAVSYLRFWGGDFSTPSTQTRKYFMSKDALKDIQQALNIIRSATDKEQYANKVKAMELVTQSLLSQIQTLKPLALVKNKAQQKKHITQTFTFANTKITQHAKVCK